MKIKPAYLFYTMLMMSNCISLYLLIDMAHYDEMVSYLKNGEEKFSSPRQVVVVYLITCLGNLLFISALMMRSIVFSVNKKVNLS